MPLALVLFSPAGGRGRRAPQPRTVAGLGPDRLRELGLSHAKATAIDGLAQRHLAGTLDTDDLDGLSDEQVVAALTATNGIGLWTARMFLIHQMRRPHALPASDLGIRQPVERASTLPGLPMIDEVREIGERWSPWCTYAVALLWILLRPFPASA
jgi:DNA-3-methyladenine glycosylase II